MIRITPKTEEEKIEHQEKIKINLAKEALRESKLDAALNNTPEELPAPSPPKSETKHGYTVEILYHFTCIKCQQWWSYATTPGQPIIDQNSKCLKGDRLYLSDEIEMNCPHCGHLSSIDIKDGFFETLMPDEESAKKAQLELEELTELEKQEMLVANQPSLSQMMQMYMPPGTELKLPKQD